MNSNDRAALHAALAAAVSASLGAAAAKQSLGRVLLRKSSPFIGLGA